MVWNDRMIREWASAGGVQPYNPDNVNPASIDLCFSGRGKMAVAAITDWFTNYIGEQVRILPGEFWILDTLEYIKMPPDTAGMLFLKSTTGRLGIEHLHAGWFDPSFKGTATLEVVNFSPWARTILKGERIVQLVLVSMSEVPERGYDVTGRYNGQSVPTLARRPKGF